MASNEFKRKADFKKILNFYGEVEANRCAINTIQRKNKIMMSGHLVEKI